MEEENMGVISILISLILLMYLAYRGVTVLILSVVLALFALVMNGETHIMAIYTEVFMGSFALYCKQYFPIFLLGAIFGKIMDDSGSAKSIAKTIANRLGVEKAVLAVVLSVAILTYGGVSMFVVAFAVFPIAAQLFKEANIPKRLIPGAIALGSFTFTMAGLPGSPQIQNTIPMPYFGTDAYAAPLLGIIASILLFGGGMIWLGHRVRQAKANGEGYGVHKNEKLESVNDENLPSILVALLPIILVLTVNLILSKFVFISGKYNDAYLAQKPYLVKLATVSGTWSLIIALVISIIVTIVCNFKRMKSVIKSLNEGAFGSLSAIINTSSVVGYGNVIKMLAGFTLIKEVIIGISKNPIVSEAISVNILSGITGSASGGMSIALGMLGQQYLEMANQMGISPEVLHRIAALASGGFDSLPHNGGIITLIGICGMTHKESYKDIAVCSVLIPIATLVVIVILANFGVV
ncbi:transporter [Clostridium botulinum]|uniref:Transporter n=2 Tax=Clostridium botulinum TaxID=1491 RepID=A0A0A0IGH0_CLOBO|nr:transporter [Clostridium botulinum C/D str. BKT75002]KEI10752.1 transporter [Clostridium botulinum C/D str. BKT2873]KGM95338.1 transporter [Clostridium botulinum D str. CCUG 7971]KGM99653.1 transporter [Clostridium botulinum C/D str. DC5]KOC47547.1 transporter [Clostridium botulinum]MCD3234646.1 GntP family permease [Clostridium botulinum D/C]